jgi:hypothetical protein
MAVSFGGGSWLYAVSVFGGAGVFYTGATRTQTVDNRMAMAYKRDDYALSINGGVAAADTTGDVPTVTRLAVGLDYGEWGFFNGTPAALIDVYRASGLGNGEIARFTSQNSNAVLKVQSVAAGDQINFDLSDQTTAATKSFVFSTGGSEKLRITSSGNVAIGTTTPWASLAVNPVAGTASNQFVVGSSTATAFVIENSGQAGIGTSTAAYALDVLAGTQTQNGNYIASFTRTGGAGGVRIGANNGIAILGGMSTAGAGSQGLAFNVMSSGADSEAARFSTAGNFGIGTTTPQWKLNVADATTPQLTLSDGSATAAPYNFRSTHSSDGTRRI